MTIQNVLFVRGKLLDFLRAEGIDFKSCHMRLHDHGLSLVVVAPTGEIPKEFQGVPVEAKESV